jgi:hypothetical protein
MSDDSINNLAKAATAISETGGKLIEATQSFGRVIKGPVEQLVGIVEDRVRFARWQRGLALADKAEAIMIARGLTRPTRELPLNFAVPLLTAAILEEDDNLQGTWAKLLVNAGDAATQIELRTAYVEILRGMSAFDVKNLSLMAEASLANPANPLRVVETWRLPHSAQLRDVHASDVGVVPRDVGISLANLARLGCAMPGSGFDAAVIFGLMTVCVEQVVRESQRLLQSRTRCGHINHKPLIGPEVLSFFDCPASIKVPLRLTNQLMSARDSAV